MQTWYIIGINGVITATFSFIAYHQAIRKNKTDFFNNQLLLIESGIDSIRDKTYELFEKIFDENTSYDENFVTIRLLTQNNNSLHNKILELDDFKKFSDDVTEYHIFSGNVIEAEDKFSAQIYLNDFDRVYSTFKSKLCKYQNEKNK